jgi:hypothetical protein
MNFLRFLMLASLAALAVSQDAARGEIQTCSGWKLNKLKAVKVFVKNDAHALSYRDLTVTFIPGHKPELVLFDAADLEIERIELAPYDNIDDLHDLVKSKGFVKTELVKTEL